MSHGDAMPVVVLISGRGSNLLALIQQSATLGIKLAAVISNRADAGGLQHARDAGIPTVIVDPAKYPDRGAYDRELARQIDHFEPALLVLAGFMRILSCEFVSHFHGRMLNIHPSLLPAFRGLHTHRRALAAGVREHGCSVHFVNTELDAGAVVIQSRVAVMANDDEASLAARVLEQEHHILPLAVSWFVDKRLRLEGEQVLFDDNPLPAGGLNMDTLDTAA